MFKLRIVCKNSLVLVISLFVGLHVAVAAEDVKVTPAEINALANNSEPLLTMSYKDGFLSADISGGSLKDVATRLAETTGAEVVLSGDKEGAAKTIWANVSKKPLPEALATILKGFSYSTHKVADTDLLKINIYMLDNENVGKLKTDAASVESAAWPSQDVESGTSNGMASPEGPATIGSAVASSGIAPVEATLAPTSQSVSSSEALAVELPPVDQMAEVPHDLDDLMLLPESSIDVGFNVNESQENNDNVWNDEMQRSARLERATWAIDSEHSHIRMMAIDELVTTKDPRATQIISNAAMRGETSVDERLQAAEALWRHAADLEFSNLTAVQSLQQLAADSDPSVAAIANRALADMDRYQRRQR